ncbi:acyltransferase domain-containing protein [Streptomyces mobaraensis NBRC 13819 = DSM 40847]|uniref:Polyketide synthase n=1 Tax=Streptomyces mobaraensis (strain ATCC 29032 / DSM 40847 / JCM 4168 / NBRC 13819 / NCIMB 11159 / IPCR 16-22) TaxID=1223523 RepID=M2ZY77_STRM1|nr:type I polyketide synthase [Streptomyces mobaraensis]EME97723.1 polyketide synthase [Streptomyces mobaraensis NBRC 13819 = DSM 40847]QTT74131.1 acyltransferase domain-containing protein [Streptomyces mobaraensis NBRC 13819 = DSM 40847]
MGEYDGTRPAPIAVVGIGCRVPGADGPDAFWRLLTDETCTVRDVPSTRFGRPYEIPGARVRSGLLDDVDRFDAGFFGISPREAAGMDPQQRLFMEAVWEALEDAGQDTSALAGTRTGVWVGTTNVHYWELQQSVGHPDIHASLGAGSRSTTTGRVSFALDVTGPGLSVDTACSSSLTALALACQSLATGESTVAIAGGSQLLLTNTENHGFVDANVFSDNCRFGDAAADGFVFSEGVGAVILKPLARALADGDPVRAVIRGWSVNNDGAGSDTMINPALSGQRQMLELAYEHAGIRLADVDYIEAHGTGTRAGDPVELGAIAAVLGDTRAGRAPLLVGSVKSNIGHTGAAAGVLGLIKTVLALQHRTVPRTLHVTERTPAVDWDAVGMDLPRAGAVPLTAEGRPLTAGVSGFGVSGTNVHVVLTEAGPGAAPAERPAGAERGAAHLLPVSAASPEALRQRLLDLAGHLETDGRSAPLDDLCHTAAVRRAHHDCRAAVVGDAPEALAARLREAAEDASDAGYAGRPRVAFVFSGHGSQWIGMARELMDASPAFSASLIRCDEAVRAETGWSVIDRLTDGTDLVHETVAVVHPVLWAVQVSLAETWRAWGVEPDVVLGHSMGESAAACVAGALSHADAAAVVCRRARLIRDRVAGRGTMSVAALTADEADRLIADLAVDVAVAASNGPRTTVLAGEVEGIEKIKAELDARDVFCRVMKAEAASHCSQMDPLLDELAHELRDLAPRAGTVPIRSTVTGELVDGSGLDAAYWTRNIRGRVHFHEAVLATAEAGETVFVEISPHPVLSKAVQETLADAGLPGTAVGSLLRDQPERETLLAHLGRVYEAGAPVDWTALYGGGRCVPLPAYPWQRESHWVEDLEALPRTYEFRLDEPGTPFLPPPAPDQDSAVVHGPECVEAARAVVARAAGTGDVRLTAADIGEALLVPPGTAPVLRVTVTPGAADGEWAFAVESRTEGAREWTGRARGTASAGRGSGRGSAGHEPPAAVLARCPEHLDGDAFRRRVPAAGALRPVLEEVWLGRGEAVARLRRPAGTEPRPGHPVHPELVRSAYQPALALLPDPSLLSPHLTGFAVTGEATEELWTVCRITEGAGGALALDTVLFDAEGRAVAEAKGMPVGERPTDDTEKPEHVSEVSEDGTVVTEHARADGTGGRRAAANTADQGVELTGELRLTDPASGFVIELRGSLRIAAPAPRGEAAPAPVRAAEPLPVAVEARVAPAAPVPAPAPVTPEAPAAAPAEAPAADRPVADRVAEHVAEVLGMRVGRLDVNKPFNRLGMDSLMATELRKRLERELGVALPVARLARGTTTASLARELAAEIPV